MMNFVATYLYLLAFNFDNVFKYSLYIVDTKKNDTHFVSLCNIDGKSFQQVA